MIDNELRVDGGRNRSKVDMPKISAQGKTFDPFRAVDDSVRPFIGNLRLQERVSLGDYPDPGAGLGQILWIASIIGNRRETLGPCRGKVG